MCAVYVLRRVCAYVCAFSPAQQVSYIPPDWLSTLQQSMSSKPSQQQTHIVWLCVCVCVCVCTGLLCSESYTVRKR